MRRIISSLEGRVTSMKHVQVMIGGALMRAARRLIYLPYHRLRFFPEGSSSIPSSTVGIGGATCWPDCTG
jgi:hypothetical protein